MCRKDTLKTYCEINATNSYELDSIEISYHGSSASVVLLSYVAHGWAVCPLQSPSGYLSKQEECLLTITSLRHGQCTTVQDLSVSMWSYPENANFDSKSLGTLLLHLGCRCNRTKALIVKEKEQNENTLQGIIWY